MEYDFVPLPHRKKLRWPNGARLAVILTINLEFWELTRDQTEPLYPGGPASIPHPVPGNVPDYVNWTWREYGHRIGVWRIIDALDSAGTPASCTMNARMATDRRAVIDAVNERGWELVPHNWAQNDILSDYANRPDEERHVVQRTLKVFEEVVGAPGVGGPFEGRVIERGGGFDGSNRLASDFGANPVSLDDGNVKGVWHGSHFRRKRHRVPGTGGPHRLAQGTLEAARSASSTGTFCSSISTRSSEVMFSLSARKVVTSRCLSTG